jgi:hypothetical protein
VFEKNSTKLGDKLKRYIINSTTGKTNLVSYALVDKLQSNSKKFELKNQYSKYYQDSKFYKKHRRGGMVVLQNNFMDDTVVNKLRRKIEREEYLALDSETEFIGVGVAKLNRNFSNLIEDGHKSLLNLQKYRTIEEYGESESNQEYKLPASIISKVLDQSEYDNSEELLDNLEEVQPRIEQPFLDFDDTFSYKKQGIYSTQPKHS